MQLSWLAMEYGLSKRASFAVFSPYFLSYGQEAVLPAFITCDMQATVKMDECNIWVEVCNTRAKLFQLIIPMACDNLVIAQHCDTLRYTTIRKRGFQLQLQRCAPCDFV